MLEKNLEFILSAQKVNMGFDALIVVTAPRFVQFWEERLEKTKKDLISDKTKVIVVGEDWEGGAGQLLGTLYAFLKANVKVDLIDLLRNGGSVAMYHTAGEGKRMAPLTFAEGNIKPAISIPKPLQEDFATILEGVIFQTQPLAAARPGRLCVFWADQIFIPEKDFSPEISSLAEIFAQAREEIITPETWKQNWQSYGILIPTQSGDALQREKLPWEKAKDILAAESVPKTEGKVMVGKSLGSFSMRVEFLEALLSEFQQELSVKQGKLDTDFDLWMPITSSEKEYIGFGGKPAYWQRMNALKLKLQHSFKNLPILSMKDIGKESIWWDFGQLKFYHQNTLKLAEKSHEGELARKFFNLERYFVPGETKNIKQSIVFNSNVAGSKIEDSVILNSDLKDTEGKNIVSVKSKLEETSLDKNVVYKASAQNIQLKPEEVLSEVKVGEKPELVRNAFSIDPKTSWDVPIMENSRSFKEVAEKINSKKE